MDEPHDGRRRGRRRSRLGFPRSSWEAVGWPRCTSRPSGKALGGAWQAAPRAPYVRVPPARADMPSSPAWQAYRVNRDQRERDHDREQCQQGAIRLAGFLDGAAPLDAIARRQSGDEGLQLLPNDGGYVRRLQAVGNVSTHGDRRRAVATTQDRVFHGDVHRSDLRQRNPLAGCSNQGEIGNPARIEPRVAGRTGRDLH